MFDTKIRIKVDTLTEKMKRAPDKRHIKEYAGDLVILILRRALITPSFFTLHPLYSYLLPVPSLGDSYLKNSCVAPSLPCVHLHVSSFN